MSDKQTFWLVWSPRSGRPRIKHWFRDAAEREAKRLAAKYEGRHFYVLEMIGYEIVGDPLLNKREMRRMADPAKNSQPGGSMDQDERNETSSEQPTTGATETTGSAEQQAIDQGDGATGEPKVEEEETTGAPV